MKKILVLLSAILLSACASTKTAKSGVGVTVSFEGATPIFYFTPAYPEAALTKHQEGTVKIGFIVGKDRKPTNLKVLASAGKTLDAETLNALEKTTFQEKYIGQSLSATATFKAD
ncbi:energy transducer TonB [Gallaecimonas kandeliae]|uniref:energy transducer TonB n=1 Tax=Gallaecimonas kandeliae TaxID=3029055 RepID=UPI00264A29AB|nr:energy transducer TonB [Gallaecimonas kandeliae]WKE67262.1 energy transducer TonB [Gallaecimonas kandeliae]